MKKKLRFNSILLAVTLSFILVSCDSSVDIIDDGGSIERTIVKMEIPSQGKLDNYNWNNATLVWSQEFDDNNSFKENWVFDKNYNNLGNSDQLQFYTEENLEVSNGKLKIIAKKIGAGQSKGDYTSSRISGRFAFEYGRIEVSAKMPAGEKNGIWSKLGLIGDNIDVVGYPNCGLINIMEYLSYRPNETYIIVHSATNNDMNGNVISANTDVETAEEEFHAYGILWTDKYIKFYVDDISNIIYTLNRPSLATEENWPFDQPFYLLAQVVVGGRFAGAEGVNDSLFPTALEIEYIRVYHAL